MTENGHRRDPLVLDPPSFQLPDDFVDNDDYELWTVRLPTSLDIKALQGMELRVPINTKNQQQQQQVMLGTFQVNENEHYGIVHGNPVEHEGFRILLPDPPVLRPLSRTFDRHVNVVDVTCLKELDEAELAPRLETAPIPTEDHTIRRSYSHIPQMRGLKRRWMPPGSTSVSPTKVSLSSSTTMDVVALTETVPTKDEPEPEPKRVQREAIAVIADVKNESTPDAQVDHASNEKKAKKEKKAAKKAKKERKRERKEHKVKRESSNS